MNRVWTYIISKNLTTQEVAALKIECHNFISGWTAHEQKLTAEFEIYKNKIIVVKAHEDVHEASGCSIDKLTRFIKDLEKKFSIELMNRLLVAYKKNDEVEITHVSNIKELLTQHQLTENTIVYNTSLANSSDLVKWEQPLKNTWLNKYL